MSCLKNKVALVTGSTGGLGKQIALHLAEAECKLFLTGRSKKKLISLRDEILTKFPTTEIFFKEANLQDQKNIKNLTTEIEKKYNNIDILINCAGVFLVSSLEDTSFKHLEESLAVNISAPFLLCKEMVPKMKKNNWGRIVNIGSSSSYEGFGNTSVYCATKHALLGFTRSLYKEVRDYGIRVFCISPGSIKTDMGKLVKNQDFNTFLRPEDIAKYICFILSFDEELITEEIRINRLHTQ